MSKRNETARLKVRFYYSNSQNFRSTGASWRPGNVACRMANELFIDPAFLFEDFYREELIPTVSQGEVKKYVWMLFPH